jgi:cell division protein ZapE
MLKKFFPTPPTKPHIPVLLKQRYLQQVEQYALRYDPAQVSAVEHLQTVLDNLTNQQKNCASLYIFGEVGRGKSMLMDLFYEACPVAQKRRVFFHAFMLEVHAFIHERQENTIEILAKKIRATSVLLCFDEFHVTDIADAMILKRLFTRLFELKTVIVLTSNRHPDDLYQGGVQKDQLLDLTRLLQYHAKLVELKAATDYRLSHAPAIKSNYYFPLDANAPHFVQQNYQHLTRSTDKQSGVLRLLGREVFLSAVHKDIALLSFAELCVKPLGSADYLQLAQQFNTLIVTDIPRLTAEKRNEAKRFVTLVDALYEHKVQLICTAEVPVQSLYTEGDGVFEFKRTVSRLIEMQSERYLRQCEV